MDQPATRIDRHVVRIQPFDAMPSLNISAGVRKPSVLRGLSFNCLAIALSPLGMHCLSNLFVFSLLPRSQAPSTNGFAPAAVCRLYPTEFPVLTCGAD